MRIKNVKNALEKIELSEYIIKDPFKNKGKFNKLFNNKNPINIEIGMGKGDFLIKSAIKYPNINFIGIEKYDNVIVRAVEKLESIKLDNLKLIKTDAQNIEDIFLNEINLIYLNFSDPWPKDRWAKRRLTSSNFLDKYESIFLKNKNIIMKTDNRKLFEFSIVSFVDKKYKINSISLDLSKDNEIDNIETEYEKKYKELGFPIYKIDVYK